MRFEKLESRIVFNSHSLGPSIELDIDTTVEVAPPEPTQSIPADLQFRSTADDFNYSSDELDPELLDQLLATSESWQEDTRGRHQVSLSEDEIWYKPAGYYSPQFVDDGHIEIEQNLSDSDLHQMVILKKVHSDCYTGGGIYTKQDQHYRISFSVRYPEGELDDWLSNHRWSLVTQMWGPRETGETARNPPFSVYTRSENGQPTWVIRSLGDSRRITGSGEFEEQNTVRIPMTGIGEWQDWDIEFVPNPFGDGMIRAWLNGDMVAEWKNIKNIYYSQLNGVNAGPLGPMFGLYSGIDNDSMNAHFDNISVECSGEFQSSIAGIATGGSLLEDNIISAKSTTTGETFATYTGRQGVFTLNVPKDTYTITAIDPVNSHQVEVANVDTTNDSPSLEIDLLKPTTPSAPSPLTFTGDVNGDGRADIINRLADGSWQVTTGELADEAATASEVVVSGRRPREDDPTTETPTAETPTTETPTTETPTTETPTTETPTTETPTTETPTTETPTTETPTTETPTTETPTTETPTTETPTTETPTTETPTTETPTTETPTTETPVEEPTAQPLSFSTSVWAQWSTNTEWSDVQIGDFTGDGLDDIAGRSSDGNWWVAESTGESFVTRHFGKWAPHITWLQVSAGDFNGDGVMDIAGRAARNGQWWIATSDGSRFQTAYWGAWTTSVDWTAHVGDFDGDGKSDIAGQASSDGTWWIARSNDNKLQTTYWGRWTQAVNWTTTVGDFNGDGKSDLAGRADGDGTIWVAESQGTHFLTKFWGRWTINVNWLDLTARDVDGDGLHDLVARADSDGTWWIAKSDGSRFVTEYWGTAWSTDVQWLAVSIDDFDGDGDADLLGENDQNWLLTS